MLVEGEFDFVCGRVECKEKVEKKRTEFLSPLPLSSHTSFCFPFPTVPPPLSTKTPWLPSASPPPSAPRPPRRSPAPPPAAASRPAGPRSTSWCVLFGDRVFVFVGDFFVCVGDLWGQSVSRGLPRASLTPRAAQPARDLAVGEATQDAVWACLRDGDEERERGASSKKQNTPYPSAPDRSTHRTLAKKKKKKKTLSPLAPSPLLSSLPPAGRQGRRGGRQGL